MLRTIRLYGELGKKYGRVHRFHVESVSSAIRMLCVNFKDFKQHLIDSTNKIAGYEVWDGKYNLGPEDKEEFVKQGVGVIKIIPRVIGASNAAKILVGVLLVAAAWFSMGTLAAAFGPGAGLWGVAASFGASLILSGVVGMMTKPASGVSIDSDSNNTQSYIFSGVQNTTKQGNPVFIAYGTHLLGSQPISVALTTGDVAI